MKPEQLVIPKYTVSAEIRDTGGRIRSVELYLSEQDTGDAPRERLQDILAARQFIPARQVRDSRIGDAPNQTPRFTLLNKEQVVWLRLDLLQAIDEIDIEAEGADESISAGVRIDLTDGSELEGSVRYLLPSGARRLGDYLETLPEFFPVRTPDYLYLVHRDSVIAVTPAEEVRR